MKIFRNILCISIVIFITCIMTILVTISTIITIIIFIYCIMIIVVTISTIIATVITAIILTKT